MRPRWKECRLPAHRHRPRHGCDRSDSDFSGCVRPTRLNPRTVLHPVVGAHATATSRGAEGRRAEELSKIVMISEGGGPTAAAAAAAAGSSRTTVLGVLSRPYVSQTDDFAVPCAHHAVDA